MRRSDLRALALASVAALFSAAGGYCQELPGSADRVLEKADAVLAPVGSSYELRLRVAVDGARALEYRLRNYVKDSFAQRAVFLEPVFDRGDSAIRKGDIAYFRDAAWPVYDAMNARSSFMDSAFSWEDALCPVLSGSYELAGIAWDLASGERLLRCVLKPSRPGAYRRIELWVRPDSYQTVKRVYYSPSGREWKTARYGGYVMEGGAASAWAMTMTDESTMASATISVSGRQAMRMPDSFFDPTNRGKEK
jgi:hypothetical protein